MTFSDELRAAFKQRSSTLANAPSGSLDVVTGGNLDPDVDATGFRVERDANGNVYIVDATTKERVGPVEFLDLVQQAGKSRDGFGRALPPMSPKRDALGRRR